MTDPITQLLATAGEVYEREISPILVMAFRTSLAGIPEADLAAAFQSHLSDPKAGAFFPKPADILRHVRAAASVQAATDFDRLMRWATGGGSLPAVSPEARRLFSEATAGASTFDLRRWTYEQWDAVRSKYLALAQLGEPERVALGHDSRAQLEHCQ